MNPALKKAVGVILLLAGLFALLTPLTPGSGLIIVGLELLGIRILFLERVKGWLKPRQANKDHQATLPVDPPSGPDDGVTPAP